MIDNNIFISTVFVAGILSFFSGCLIPLIPVYISMFAGGIDEESSSKYIIKIGKLKLNTLVIAKTVVFVAGISTSFIILGFGAGAFGAVINSNWFVKVCGIVVIFLGIHQTGLLHLNFLEREKRIIIKSNKGILKTFFLGFSLSFGWTPCIGPILATILGFSATGGVAIYGAWLMFIYSLGFMIPFLIIAIFSDLLLTRVRLINKHLEKIKIIGGVIIIIMGIVLMSNNLNIVTRLFTN